MLSLLIALALAPLSLADVPDDVLIPGATVRLVLVDGSLVTGEVVESGPAQLIVKLPDGTPRTLKRGELKGLQDDAPRADFKVATETVPLSPAFLWEDKAAGDAPQSEVVLGAPIAQGDPKHIADVGERYRGQLAYCHEAQLRTTPEISGQIVLAFTVKGGKVTGGVNVATNTTASPALAECISRKVVRWTFSDDAAGTVEWPMEFEVAE